jgi:hypothetical protein
LVEPLPELKLMSWVESEPVTVKIASGVVLYTALPATGTYWLEESFKVLSAELQYSPLTV